VNSDIPVHQINIPDKVKKQALYIQKINEFRKRLYKTMPPEQNKKIHYFNLMNDTIAVMTNQLATAIIKNNPPDILVNVSKKSCGTYDFYKAEELVEIGRYAAREKLDS
jgi:NTE family protein